MIINRATGEVKSVFDSLVVAENNFLTCGSLTDDLVVLHTGRFAQPNQYYTFSYERYGENTVYVYQPMEQMLLAIDANHYFSKRSPLYTLRLIQFGDTTTEKKLVIERKDIVTLFPGLALADTDEEDEYQTYLNVSELSSQSLSPDGESLLFSISISDSRNGLYLWRVEEQKLDETEGSDCTF